MVANKPDSSSLKQSSALRMLLAEMCENVKFTQESARFMKKNIQVK